MSTSTTHTTVTIASGQTVSDAVDCISYLPCGFDLPSTFDGTTITFQGSVDGSTYRTCKNDQGDAISITCAANTLVLIEPQTFAGSRYIKLVAGTAQSTTDTTIKVALYRPA